MHALSRPTVHVPAAVVLPLDADAARRAQVKSVHGAISALIQRAKSPEDIWALVGARKKIVDAVLRGEKTVTLDLPLELLNDVQLSLARQETGVQVLSEREDSFGDDSPPASVVRPPDASVPESGPAAQPAEVRSLMDKLPAFDSGKFVHVGSGIAARIRTVSDDVSRAELYRQLDRKLSVIGQLPERRSDVQALLKNLPDLTHLLPESTAAIVPAVKTKPQVVTADLIRGLSEHTDPSALTLACDSLAVWIGKVSDVNEQGELRKDFQLALVKIRNRASEGTSLRDAAIGLLGKHFPTASGLGAPRRSLTEAEVQNAITRLQKYGGDELQEACASIAAKIVEMETQGCGAETAMHLRHQLANALLAVTNDGTQMEVVSRIFAEHLEEHGIESQLDRQRTPRQRIAGLRAVATQDLAAESRTIMAAIGYVRDKGAREALLRSLAMELRALFSAKLVAGIEKECVDFTTSLKAVLDGSGELDNPGLRGVAQDLPTVHGLIEQNSLNDLILENCSATLAMTVLPLINPRV